MEADEFKRASHAVWEAMAPGWDERHAYFEQIARPVTERMLERLEPEAGETILELAAGTGAVGLAAAAIVGPDGRVILSDFSSAMIESAERHAESLGFDQVECRVQDAERLDLPDEAVDGVLCRWAYMLMADPAAAFAETGRVLRRGGRISSAVFAAPEQNPWAALPSRVLQERGHMPPPEAGDPGIFALFDPERLRRLFAQAGLSEPRIEEVSFTWRFEEEAEYWAFLEAAAGAIAMVLGRLDQAERGRVRAEIAGELERFRGGDGIALPAVSLIASASKDDGGD